MTHVTHQNIEKKLQPLTNFKESSHFAESETPMAEFPKLEIDSRYCKNYVKQFI